jgi:hypothetical protein
MKLVEFAPGRFRIERKRAKAARSNLPLPYVISDIMEPTEQVDGKFYTSKRQFRAVGRALGLIEVGNEKLPPKTRASAEKGAKEARQRSIRKALAQYRSGVRTTGP